MTTQDPTHYSVLGITTDADAEFIKRAYRHHASRNHPDLGGSQDAMGRLNQAYEVLSDPQRRREYDETLQRSARPADDARKTPFEDDWGSAVDNIPHESAVRTDKPPFPHTADTATEYVPSPARNPFPWETSSSDTGSGPISPDVSPNYRPRHNFHGLAPIFPRGRVPRTLVVLLLMATVVPPGLVISSIAMGQQSSTQGVANVAFYLAAGFIAYKVAASRICTMNIRTYAIYLTVVVAFLAFAFEDVAVFAYCSLWAAMFVAAVESTRRELRTTAPE